MSNTSFIAKFGAIYNAGGSGTSDYHDLENKPSLNGVTLEGDLTTEDIGITAPEIAAEKDGHTLTVTITHADGSITAAEIYDGETGATGPAGETGPAGPAGSTGADGRGIASVIINPSTYMMTITYTDGTSETVGQMITGAAASVSGTDLSITNALIDTEQETY